MVLHSTGPVEDPAVIIMLTKTHESGREKCFQYFPHSEKSPIHLSPTDAFGDNLSGSINLVSSHYDDNARTTVRELQIDVKADGKKVQKKVWHLLFTGWPDFGVPSGEDRVALLSLVKLSDALNTGGTENPRVVHCSAGVGRSGTFIALDYLLGELNEGAMDDGQGVMGKNGHQAESPGKRRKTSSHGDGFEDDPIALTVDRLRQQRMMMVQGESQFHFLYELVREQWLERQGRNREAKEKKEELASKK
jgi:protein-tyrosine phosphatase